MVDISYSYVVEREMLPGQGNYVIQGGASSKEDARELAHRLAARPDVLHRKWRLVTTEVEFLEINT